MGEKADIQMEQQKREEYLEYFREHPVLGKLLAGFRDKYESYGRFAGTVILKNLTEQEREDLEGFFRQNYHGKKSASISAQKFERALAESRFAGVNGKEVLEWYFKDSMEGRSEQRQRERKQWEELLDRALKTAAQRQDQRYAAVWVSELKASLEGEGEKAEGTMFLSYLKKRWREAEGDFLEAERLLMLGVRILSALPAKGKYLAVFSAEITGSPHSFDRGTKDGKYLELLLFWYAKKDGSEMNNGFLEREFPSIKKQKIYLKAGLLWDDMSNYAMAAGLLAIKKDKTPHKGMEGFLSEGEPVQIPLSVIAGWERVCSPENRIYIVENPSVYSMLCGRWKKNCALMCMNGQPRLSSLLILDLLAKSGTAVWYAGDFDPEGLLIAQKLKRYYQGEFYYWHMSAEDYKKSISGEAISEKRKKMLDKITDPQIADTASSIAREGKAGYQENIWELYMEN